MGAAASTNRSRIESPRHWWLFPKRKALFLQNGPAGDKATPGGNHSRPAPEATVENDAPVTIQANEGNGQKTPAATSLSGKAATGGTCSNSKASGKLPVADSPSSESALYPPPANVPSVKDDDATLGHENQLSKLPALSGMIPKASGLRHTSEHLSYGLHALGLGPAYVAEDIEQILLRPSTAPVAFKVQPDLSNLPGCKIKLSPLDGAIIKKNNYVGSLSPGKLLDQPGTSFKSRPGSARPGSARPSSARPGSARHTRGPRYRRTAKEDAHHFS